MPRFRLGCVVLATAAAFQLACSSGKSSGPGQTTPVENPNTGGSAGSGGVGPAAACEPVLPGRVTRLSDRHYANSVRDLLGLSESPAFETSSSSTELFLANKATPVTGAVALKMRDLLEALVANFVGAGAPAAACTGDERGCADAFITSFAGRAFRRAVSDVERQGLLTVYDSGKTHYGGHAGGIRLLTEAVLQSPAFIYQTELGTAAAGRRTLTQHELAAKLSYFLLDSIPDAELWQAAETGQLTGDAQLTAQVERLLAMDTVKRNVTQIFVRLFQLERIFNVNKADSITEFTPALVQSMHAETKRFIDGTLWKRSATLMDLLTSRETSVDAPLAAIYGLEPQAAPGPDGFIPVTLPANQRAGILTQPSILTIEALPDGSSVIHRGVFIVRELLCFHPPPPQPAFLEQAEQLFERTETERERAEVRRGMPVCAGCHATFDPFGIAFEHYDTLGRYRDSLTTSKGNVPVDATWDYNLADITGSMDGAIQLAERLAQSPAVRECMTRQLASYAYGQRLNDAQTCTIRDMSQRFERAGTNLVELVKLTAMWPGLSQREEVLP